MNFLLKTKHWIILSIILIPSFSLILIDTDQTILYAIGSALTGIMYELWLFSIIWGINKELNNKNIKAYIGFIYICFYIILFLCIQYNFKKTFPYWQIPFHLLAVFASFWNIRMASKKLVEYELFQKSFKSSIFETFIMLWFFPVGIFYVQPRVSKIIDSK